jgi:hypothetical protein
LRKIAAFCFTGLAAERPSCSRRHAGTHAAVKAETGEIHHK